MKVFVTGASGHIASAVIPALIGAGHNVLGLARSEAAALAVGRSGAHVHRGSLEDPDSLRAGVLQSDAVVHLAFDHDAVFAGDYVGAVTKDQAVVAALGDGLVGTGKTLIGIGMSPSGSPDEAVKRNPRAAIPLAIADYERRGVRTVLIAIPPVTHSEQDRRGFVPSLIRFARGAGVSRYVGDGANHWPAAHALDVADLFVLALDKAPSGAGLCAAAESGIPVRSIAEAIARHLDVGIESIGPDRVTDCFPGFPFVAVDLTMSSDATRDLVGWKPTRPGLLADIDSGYYFI